MGGTRVGINGFGRMGRLALRAAWGWPDLEFVHVNELAGDAATAAHLLTFDSVHGRWAARRARRRTTRSRSTGERVGFSERADARRACRGTSTASTSCWSARGKFRTPEALAPYFDAGVRKVIVAAPVKDGRAERRGRRQRPPLRPDAAPPADRGVLHDQLPGAGGQGDPRGHRHPPRRRSRRSTTSPTRRRSSTRRTRTCAAPARRRCR